MSFRSELAELAAAADEEFGEPVVHIPTTRLPNSRPTPDPNRPPYELCGIFDPNGKDGSMPPEADLMKEFKGRHRPMIATLSPTLTVRICNLRYEPVQGDEIVILEDNERYRITDVTRAMQGMKRLCLEQLGRPKHE